VVMVGAYNSREHDSFVDCCPEQIRVNRSFVEMKVEYGPRGAPLEKSGRGSGAPASSTKGSDEPFSKRSKRAGHFREMNLFKAAILPINFCMSLMDHVSSMFLRALTLSRLPSMPLVETRHPSTFSL